MWLHVLASNDDNYNKLGLVIKFVFNIANLFIQWLGYSKYNGNKWFIHYQLPKRIFMIYYFALTW